MVYLGLPAGADRCVGFDCSSDPRERHASVTAGCHSHAGVTQGRDVYAGFRRDYGAGLANFHDRQSTL
jgi:hypothetical protein